VSPVAGVDSSNASAERGQCPKESPDARPITDLVTRSGSSTARRRDGTSAFRQGSIMSCCSARNVIVATGNERHSLRIASACRSGVTTDLRTHPALFSRKPSSTD